MVPVFVPYRLSSFSRDGSEIKESCINMFGAGKDKAFLNRRFGSVHSSKKHSIPLKYMPYTEAANVPGMMQFERSRHLTNKEAESTILSLSQEAYSPNYYSTMSYLSSTGAIVWTNGRGVGTFPVLKYLVVDNLYKYRFPDDPDKWNGNDQIFGVFDWSWEMDGSNRIPYDTPKEHINAEINHGTVQLPIYSPPLYGDEEAKYELHLEEKADDTDGLYFNYDWPLTPGLYSPVDRSKYYKQDRTQDDINAMSPEDRAVMEQSIRDAEAFGWKVLDNADVRYKIVCDKVIKITEPEDEEEEEDSDDADSGGSGEETEPEGESEEDSDTEDEEDKKKRILYLDEATKYEKKGLDELDEEEKFDQDAGSVLYQDIIMRSAPQTIGNWIDGMEAYESHVSIDVRKVHNVIYTLDKIRVSSLRGCRSTGLARQCIIGKAMLDLKDKKLGAVARITVLCSLDSDATKEFGGSDDDPRFLVKFPSIRTLEGAIIPWHYAVGKIKKIPVDFADAGYGNEFPVLDTFVPVARFMLDRWSGIRFSIYNGHLYFVEGEPTNSSMISAKRSLGLIGNAALPDSLKGSAVAFGSSRIYADMLGYIRKYKDYSEYFDVAKKNGRRSVYYDDDGKEIGDRFFAADKSWSTVVDDYIATYNSGLGDGVTKIERATSSYLKYGECDDIVDDLLISKDSVVIRQRESLDMAPTLGLLEKYGDTFSESLGDRLKKIPERLYALHMFSVFLERMFGGGVVSDTKRTMEYGTGEYEEDEDGNTKEITVTVTNKCPAGYIIDRVDTKEFFYTRRFSMSEVSSIIRRALRQFERVYVKKDARGFMSYTNEKLFYSRDDGYDILANSGLEGGYAFSEFEHQLVSYAAEHLIDEGRKVQSCWFKRADMDIDVEDICKILRLPKPVSLLNNATLTIVEDSISAMEKAISDLTKKKLYSTGYPGVARVGVDYPESTVEWTNRWGMERADWNGKSKYKYTGLNFLSKFKVSAMEFYIEVDSYQFAPYCRRSNPYDGTCGSAGYDEDKVWFTVCPVDDLYHFRIDWSYNVGECGTEVEGSAGGDCDDQCANAHRWAGAHQADRDVNGKFVPLDYGSPYSLHKTVGDVIEVELHNNEERVESTSWDRHAQAKADDDAYREDCDVADGRYVGRLENFSSDGFDGRTIKLEGRWRKPVHFVPGSDFYANADRGNVGLGRENDYRRPFALVPNPYDLSSLVHHSSSGNTVMFDVTEVYKLDAYKKYLK